MNHEINGLVYNWNLKGDHNPENKIVAVHDETLRDGLQSPSVKTYPNLDTRLQLLRLMDEIGIDCANVGFPASSKIQAEIIGRITQHKIREKWNMKLMCAARTTINDVQSIVDVSQAQGMPLEAGIFIGSSRLRAFISQWDLEGMTKKVVESIRFARKHGLPVMFVTEDTTRAFPETLQTLYSAAIDNGATKLCICDTVGFADPTGTHNVVTFIKNEIVKDQKVDSKPVELEWHGHRDRGLDMANTLAAIEAGVTRVESTLLGIGERAGNTPTEALILNLILSDYYKVPTNLSTEINKLGRRLKEVAKLFAKSIEYEIPSNHPLLGEEAFNTASGVHADAILKGLQMNRLDMAWQIYCGFNPEIVGSYPKARVGQMSGKSNVILALRELGFTDINDDQVQRILQHAKANTHQLTDGELINLVQQ